MGHALSRNSTHIFFLSGCVCLSEASECISVLNADLLPFRNYVPAVGLEARLMIRGEPAIGAQLTRHELVFGWISRS
jgi:hypothetical protein